MSTIHDIRTAEAVVGSPGKTILTKGVDADYIRERLRIERMHDADVSVIGDIDEWAQRRERLKAKMRQHGRAHQ